MARIESKGEDEADGLLREVYDEVAEQRGRVANVFRVESLNPAVMRAHLNFYMSIMYGPSGLARREREMIAMTVSNLNRCRYCTTHHTEALSTYVKDDAAVRAIKTDYGTAPISAKEKAMLSYATKVTTSPDEVGEADIARLREEGFSDREVLDATFVAAYFNFVNRLVLALGVELERDPDRTYRY